VKLCPPPIKCKRCNIASPLMRIEESSTKTSCYASPPSSNKTCKPLHQHHNDNNYLSSTMNLKNAPATLTPS